MVVSKVCFYANINFIRSFLAPLIICVLLRSDLDPVPRGSDIILIVFQTQVLIVSPERAVSGCGNLSRKFCHPQAQGSMHLRPSSLTSYDLFSQ